MNARGMAATFLLPLLLATAGSGAAVPKASPAAGHYDARLCVTVSTQPAQCGAADAQVSPEGEVRLRVHDITYLLSFEQGVLLGVTLHGSMQVAEFVSSYRWSGDTLMFGDGPRGLQYEVQLRPPGHTAPTAPTAPASQ